VKLVVFHPEARTELREATAYYDRRRVDLVPPSQRRLRIRFE